MRKHKILLTLLSAVLLTGHVSASGPGLAATEPAPAPTAAAAEAEYTPLSDVKNNGAFNVKADGGVIDLSDFGMKITLPESLQDIPIAVNGYVEDGRTVANLCLADESECVFGEVFAYPEQQALDALIDKSSGMTEEMVLELGKNETLHYYVLRLDELRRTAPEYFEEQIMSKVSEERRAQYEALLDALPDVISGMELTEIRPTQEISAPELDAENMMDYTMPDLNGQQIRLGDLIIEHRLTMINVWGVSCGVCMREIPHLVSLRERYGSRGFEIIGLAADLLDPDGAVDPELVEEAKEITAELGADYPVLAMTKEIRGLMKITATPTTYFVSSSGQVIGEAVLGSRDEAVWEDMILSALAAAEKTQQKGRLP